MPDGYNATYQPPARYDDRKLAERVAHLEKRVESLYDMIERRDKKIRALERRHSE